VSTRRVDELVQAMGLSGISKSQVSKLCKEIDERVHAFLDRPLAGEWPYLWLDATYLKQREGGRIVSVAAIIAVAVNTEGKREIVGLHIGPSEAETFWSTFLKSLARRGLRGVKLVISDAHEGLKAATRRVFGAGWHTDSPFLAQPPAISMLYAVEVPPYGGDTIWANGVLAYETLSPTMKAMIAPLKVRMSMARVVETAQAGPLELARAPESAFA